MTLEMSEHHWKYDPKRGIVENFNDSSLDE